MKLQGIAMVTQRAHSADTYDEADLVARLQQGDATAFETMVRAETPRMLAVARRMVINEEDARDVVQDAFLQAFRNIDKFEGNAKLSTWLHRVAVNAALMKMRKSKRKHPEKAIEPLLPQFEADGHLRGGVGGGWQPQPDDPAMRRETRRLIRASIDQLPDIYRTVLVMRDIEDISTEETAKLLEISEGAVKTRLHRARLALRELLDPYMRGDSI